MESYRRLEEVRRYSNKELKVSREIIEAVRGQKDYTTLGKLKSFPSVQVIVLNFWVERGKETGMLMVE